MEVILNRIDVHCDGFTGIYVFENETTVCLDVQALYDVFKDGALSLCKIIFTDDGEGGTYCDLYNDNGELACMTGEEVYVTNIDEQTITFRNDYGESSIYFILTKQELEYAGLGEIWK